MIFMVLQLFGGMLKCYCNHRLYDSATRTLNSTIAAVVDMNLAMCSSL